MSDFRLKIVYIGERRICRNDQAISATSEKYGQYCKTIAKNILCSEEDAEECVNDTYLNAWNAMPTHWPEHLATFLGKITRNLSFNKYRHDHTEKRGGGEIAFILDELTDCVSDADNVEQIIDRQELIMAVDSFAASLSIDKRNRRDCVRKRDRDRGSCGAGKDPN